MGNCEISRPIHNYGNEIDGGGNIKSGKRKKADEGIGKAYNVYEIHLLVGWSGVSNMKNLSFIWQQF